MTFNDPDEEGRHTNLVDLLRRIDREIAVPPADPAREVSLLSAFDAARDRQRPALIRSRWIALAATLVVIAGAGAIWIKTGGDVSNPSRAEATTAAADEPEAGEFVMWPGASALPPLDNGQLVRMDLPASMLPSLGFFPPASDATVVRADLLIGQDGLARAVRWVSVIHEEVQP